ncbi:MAG TPA: hypothetical protein VFA48_10715 [Gammaproteobacteria bacterium]|nr:hypothetical protein [Gammaproteobacteria bacterium]
MKRLGQIFTSISLAVLAGAAFAGQPTTVTVGSAGVVRYLQQGQPPVVILPTVAAAQGMRAAHAAKGGHGKGGGGGSTTNNLLYGGGVGGIGVETAPKIYLVFWGSQWSSDPSGEASLLQSFIANMGGSSWFNTVTQYCQGVPSGTQFCNGAGTPAGNQSGMLQGVWYDSGTTVKSHLRQSDIANEAVRAAAHFGNTTASPNDNADYVIALPTGVTPQGFGTQYCAYHSYTSSSYGNVAYTNLPYITDAGSSCGANFNGLGADAGITIVGGHEIAEAATDQFPSGGWLDSGGSEIGDKCAWISSGQGASADVSLNGTTYAVQSLWSNAFNNGGGGCVLSY